MGAIQQKVSEALDKVQKEIIRKGHEVSAPDVPEYRAKLNALRFLKAEFLRGDSKECTDIEAMVVIKRYIKNELSILVHHPDPLAEKILEFLDKEFLPTKLTEEFITNWINSNIDFTQYNNRMSAMKDIMKGLKEKGVVDGNTVKSILMGK